MNRDIRDHFQNLYAHLQKSEGNITNSVQDGFWSTGPTYRFNMVTEDFNRILLHIDFAIENLERIFPNISDVQPGEPYFQGNMDMEFWYHLDQLVKSISSGWDRLAILLDMAFGTNLTTRINLDTVLKAIPKEYSKNEYLIQIRNIQQKELRFLEEKRGVGIRHQATHFMTLGTRFWFEFLENFSLGDNTRKIIMQEDWFQQIILQKEYLITGKENVIDLIESLNFNEICRVG